MITTRMAVLGAVLAGLGAVAGAAETPMVGFLDPNFKRCDARSYDDAHMKAHPKQTVTAIAFSFLPASADDKAAGAISATIAVTLKGSTTPLYGAAYCTNGAKASGFDVDCIIDEDGGRFSLEQRDQGVLLTNPVRFRVAPNTGDHDADMAKAVDIDPKDDQESFLLSSQASPLCE